MHAAYQSRLIKMTIGAGFFMFLVLITMTLDGLYQPCLGYVVEVVQDSWKQDWPHLWVRPICFGDESYWADAGGVIFTELARQLRRPWQAMGLRSLLKQASMAVR